jgi:hypothetical protein
MADKKISQLTAATTPLAGTEVLPIVQGGSTVKVSVDDLTAGKAVSASALTVSGGTVNGVGYLNASKALITDAALVFDGTKLGVGVASPLQKLHVATAGNNYILSHNTAGSTSALLIGSESGKNTLYSWTTPSGATGRPFAIYAGATEHSRFETDGDYLLQNGNIVIGTATKGVEFPSSLIWRTGTGTPEGAVTAPVGSLFTRTDGGAGTTLYVKETGAGNTGWVAK